MMANTAVFITLICSFPSKVPSQIKTIPAWTSRALANRSKSLTLAVLHVKFPCE